MTKKLYIAALMLSIATTNVVAIANAAEVSKTVIKNEISDKVITDAIVGQYMVNKNAKELNLSVIASKGLVTLSGNVPTNEVKEELEKIAQGTNGVKEVVSKFVVNTAKENNLIITKRVKANLLNEKAIKSLDIRVETDDFVVTMTGDVPTNDTKELIETIVKNTDGVKDFNSKLEVNSNLEVK
jgi:hyperosmotically inducible periplasmic protein